MEAEPMFICDFCACLMDISNISKEDNIIKRKTTCPQCGFSFNFSVNSDTNEILEIIK